MPAFCAARSYIGLVFIISFQTALRMLVQIIILSCCHDCSRVFTESAVNTEKPHITEAAISSHWVEISLSVSMMTSVPNIASTPQLESMPMAVPAFSHGHFTSVMP